MKKFVTMDILKKLVMPTLVVLLIPSCATFAYHGTEDQPYVKETVRRVVDREISRDPRTWNYFASKVIKVLEIRNPLNHAIKLVYICGDGIPQEVKLPAHTWSESLYMTDGDELYEKTCYVKYWINNKEIR